jgi:hypothetical protein
MNSPSQPNPTVAKPQKWNYVEIEVRDGKRSLRPTHVCSVELIFKEPPALASGRIEIIITNNGKAHSSQALVLSHDIGSTRIPIQLIDAEQSAPAKLTA